ncbi:restriction endonuclease subunit S [Rheinheimera gaetbuli]
MIPKVTLSALFQIGSSKRVLKSQWRDSGVPFYRGREVTKLSQDGCVENDLFIDEDLYEQLLKKYGVPTQGDIVITAIGTIGNTYIVKDNDKFYFKDASVLWLKRTSDVVSEYINYWFKSTLMREQLEVGNGATVDTLTISKLQSLIVPILSVSEQKRIVAILDQAFADIDQARATAETNLKNARELFESYLQQVFSQRGEGWIDTTIGDETDLLTGYAFKSREYVEHTDSVPLIRGDNIVQGKLRWDGVKLWPKDKVSEFEKYLLAESDIVLAMDRTWVKAGMKYSRITEDDLPALLVQRVARLRCLKSLNSDYLYHLVGSKLFESYVISIQTGLGVPHISGKQIQSFRFKKPDSRHQKLVVDTLNKLANNVLQLTEIYQKKLSSLDELKKSILHKAFTGELTKSKGIAA